MPRFDDPQPPPRIEPMADPATGLSGKGKAGIAAALLTILAGVYANEGGYVNNPDDPGGATRFGVTQQVARRSGYAGDMRNFPQHCPEIAPRSVCADKIYIAQYIEAPGYMPMVAIEPAVAEELVDTAVNMGPPRPSRWFQQSLNELAGARLKVDGKVGRATIDAYADYQLQAGAKVACVQVLDALDARQAAEYRRLAAASPAQRTFLKGWLAHRIGNVDRRKCGKGTS